MTYDDYLAPRPRDRAAFRRTIADAAVGSSIGPRVLPMDAYRQMTVSDRRAFETLATLLEGLGFSVKVGKASPKWQIGDVVILRFHDGRNSKPYTYVHDGSKFPGVTRDVSEELMTRYWKAGQATLVVRAGWHYQDVPAAER